MAFDWSEFGGQVASSAVSGLGGLIGSIGAGKRQRKLMDYQAKLQYDYQQRAADAQLERERSMWDYTTASNRAYESPSAQRKRLEDANLLGASLFSGSSPGMPSVQGSPGAGSASGPSVGLPGFEQSSPGAAAAQNFMSMALQAAQIKDVNASADLKSQQATTETTKQTLNTASTALQGALELSAKAKAALDNMNTAIIDATSASTIALAEQNVKNAEANLKKFISEAKLNDAYRARAGFESHQISVQTQLFAAQIGVARATAYAMRARGDLDRANIPLIQQLVTNAVYDGTIKDFASRESKALFEGFDGIQPLYKSTMKLAQIQAGFAGYEKSMKGVGDALGGAMNLALMFLALRGGKGPTSLKRFAGFR